LGNDNRRELTMKSSVVKKQKRKKRKIMKAKEDVDYIEFIEDQMITQALELDRKRKQEYIV
jgi:hypothetical protein